jgi:hypothetical protein
MAGIGRRVGQAGLRLKGWADRNAQYLLDHRCDCRRYCRAVVFGASLTLQLDSSSEKQNPRAVTSRASSPDSCHTFTVNRVGGVRGRSAGSRGAAAEPGCSSSGQLGVHWNVTVLDPSAVVPIFDTTCCEPLFMQ